MNIQLLPDGTYQVTVNSEQLIDISFGLACGMDSIDNSHPDREKLSQSLWDMRLAIRDALVK